MSDQTMRLSSILPFKSVAVALLFSVVLGPIGLLYASYWGGLLMLLVAIVVVNNLHLFPILLTWMICCVWAVGSVERYNKSLLKSLQQQ